VGQMSGFGADGYRLAVRFFLMREE
jgi:3-dehydroquinate dehydratase